MLGERAPPVAAMAASQRAGDSAMIPKIKRPAESPEAERSDLHPGETSKRHSGPGRSRSASPGPAALESQGQAVSMRAEMGQFLRSRGLLTIGDGSAANPGARTGQLTDAGDLMGWLLGTTGEQQKTLDTISVCVDTSSLGDESGLGQASPDGSYKLALGARCQACGMPASHALPVMRIETADRDKAPTLRCTVCVLCYEATRGAFREPVSCRARSYYILQLTFFMGVYSVSPSLFWPSCSRGYAGARTLSARRGGFSQRFF